VTLLSTRTWEAVSFTLAITAFSAWTVASRITGAHPVSAGGQALAGGALGALLGFAWGSVAGRPVAAIEESASGLTFYRGFGAAERVPFAAVRGVRRLYARAGVSLLIDVERGGAVVRYMAAALVRADADRLLASLRSRGGQPRAAKAEAYAGLRPFFLCIACGTALPAALAGGLAGLAFGMPMAIAACVACVVTRAGASDALAS
jgi:hypothetical protein